MLYLLSSNNSSSTPINWYKLSRAIKPLIFFIVLSFVIFYLDYQNENDLCAAISKNHQKIFLYLVLEEDI